MESVSNCQVIAYKKVSHSEQKICKLLANVKKEKLSELVTRRLNDLDMKKSHLAKLLDVSRTYVTDMSNGTANTPSGEYNPSPEIIQKLSLHLQVPTNEIYNAIAFTSSELVSSKPQNVEEFIDRLSEMGFAFGSFNRDKLRELPPEYLQSLLDDIEAKILFKIR